jgi:hypothetical protein
MTRSAARSYMRVVAFGVAGVLAATGLAVGVTASAVTTPTISLGAASGYAILARDAITNVGTSALVGATGNNNVGLNNATLAAWAVPGGTISGLETVSQADSAATNAQMGVAAAYSTVAALGRDYGLVATLDALTLTPGVYDAVTAVNMAASQTLTLDAQGNASAMFVLRVHGALTLGANGVVSLVNSAQAANVIWVVDGAVTIGAQAAMVGVIITPAAITLGASASLRGQALSMSGAITLDSNTIANSSIPTGGGTPSATPTASPSATASPGASSTTSPSSSASASGSGATVVWLDDRLSADIQVGAPYSDELSVASSLAPAVEINSAVFSVSAGRLPSGLFLSSSTGVISGTPNATGTFMFTVEAAIAGLPISSKQYVLSTLAGTALATVWIDRWLPRDLTVGTALAERLTAGTSDRPSIVSPNATYFIDFGDLPPGLKLTDGVVHGTPTTPGIYVFGVDAKVAGHSVATETFTLKVAGRSGQSAGAAPGVGAITSSDIASARVIYRMRPSGRWVVVPRFREASRSIPVYAHFTVVRSPVGRQSKNIPAARAKARALAKANLGRTGQVINGKLWRGPARIIVNW